jgi:hypothetical protein
MPLAHLYHVACYESKWNTLVHNIIELIIRYCSYFLKLPYGMPVAQAWDGGCETDEDDVPDRLDVDGGRLLGWADERRRK